MRILVYGSTKKEKAIYERIVHYDGSISIDFNLLLKALKILYGDGCIIVFECV